MVGGLAKAGSPGAVLELTRLCSFSDESFNLKREET